MPLVIIATAAPTPTFPGTNPRWSGTKLLLQFSSVFKSSSTTVAGGCDVNGGEIAGYFPTPRANKCHAYSWIRNVTGTMTRHTMCVQGRYGHSFDLSRSNVSFRARIIRRRKNSTILIETTKRFQIFVAVKVYPAIYRVMILCSPPCRWGLKVPPKRRCNTCDATP